MWAQTWTGSAPAAGKFFLYNVGAGKFINSGDRTEQWGTNAFLTADFGLDFTLEAASGTNSYNLRSGIDNGNNNIYLATSTWCDGGAVAWTFAAVDGETNTYTISNNGSYLVANDALNDLVYGALTNDNKSYWKLVSYEDIRSAMLAKSYSATDPMNVSFFIQGRSFNRNDTRNSSWTTSHSDGNWSWIKNAGTNAQYQGNEAYNNTFDVYQTLTDMPAGTYEVQCSGFGTSGTTFVYGNDQEGALTDQNSEANGSKDTAWQLIDTQNKWAGQSSGTFVVGDGTIKLGVKRTNNTGYNWAVFDEFRLFYYGLDLSAFETALADAVSTANALNGKVPTPVYTTLAGVVTENNETYSTPAEYTSATNAINDAIATAQSYVTSYALVLDAKALYNQTDYTDANSAKATFKGYIDAADEATTLEALNTVVANIKSHVLDFATAVTLDANAYFDLTNFLVVNPTVSENSDGWTTEKTSGNGPTTSYGETEFYNANFNFYQNLTLPRGTWEFGVTGFHRGGEGDYTTYFYAGEDDKILVPGALRNVVNTMEEAKTYFDNGNGKVALKFALEGESNALKIGIVNTDTQTDKWTIFRNFTLKFYGSAIDYSIYQANWDAALAAANAAKEAHSTVTVGTEYDALTAAIANTPTGNSKADFTTKTDALTAATAAFTAVAENYEALAREIVKAKALGIADADVDKYAATAATTGAVALTNTQALMVDEYNYVGTNYSHAVELGTWNQSENAGTMTSQHWDGTSTSVYLEQGGGDKAYNLTSWTVTYDQNLTLPAGNYVFKVAGRTATDHVTLTLNVTNVKTNEVLGTVNDFPKGDTGLGINKAGATSFDAEDAAGFAFDGVGRGWQWRYVKFTLAEPATVKVGVVAVADAKSRWMGFCNATVQTDEADNVALMEALVALNDATTAATLTQHTNVGAGVFQYETSTDNTLWSAYTTAKSAAEAFELTAESTVENVNALTTALTTARAAYTGNTAIIAPVAATRYQLTLAGKGALTFFKNEKAQSGYGMPFQTAGAYKAQSFQFEVVPETTNTYYIYFTDNEGQKRYICNGVPWAAGTGASGIRTLLASDIDAENNKTALAIAIQPADAVGVFYMLNTTVSNAKLGAQNNGDLYTVADNSDWSIAEASQAEVTATAKAGKFGTVVFPFVPEVAANENVKFYTVTGVEGESVKLAEAETLAANTPYLIKNTSSEDYSQTFTGWGLATADKVDGTLTGVYTAQTIPASVAATEGTAGQLRYVLQTQSGTQAFYKVSADFTATAYKCFLTVPVAATGSGEVKAFHLDFNGSEDAISVLNADAENGVIYNLAGQRLGKVQRSAQGDASHLKKGVNIINGKKVFVK